MRATQAALLGSVVLCLLLVAGQSALEAAKLTIELGDSPGVSFVGAFNRWDQDGNLRKPVNKDAKIDAPEADATAVKAGRNRWVFEKLAPGKYDLVIMAASRLRVEGWHYAPVLEFDPFFPPDASTDEKTRSFVSDHIRKSRHYENKVLPLYMGGDKKVVRVLVMLIRDKTTSYEGIRAGAATMRHEIWQYTWNYGGWVKEKRTRVLDRTMLHRDELRQWTWVWDPKLGGIEVKSLPLVIRYKLPKLSGPDRPKGLYPY